MSLYHSNLCAGSKAVVQRMGGGGRMRFELGPAGPLYNNNRNDKR